MCEQGKIEYSSAAQAQRAITRSHVTGCRVYPHAGHFHITSTLPRPTNPKHQTSKTSTGPQPYIPSAKTLRGRLENAARSIAAQQRYVDKAERVRAAQFAKAEAIKKHAEQDHADTIRASSFLS
jgi:hypothetical protein